MRDGDDLFARGVDNGAQSKLDAVDRLAGDHGRATGGDVAVGIQVEVERRDRGVGSNRVAHDHAHGDRKKESKRA